MRGLIRVVVVLCLAGAGLLGAAAPASAHPLGNFTVNAYAGITVGRGSVAIDYVLDMAEIPTFRELTRVDTDSDGVVDEEERRAGASRTAEELMAGMFLMVDEQPAPLTLVGSRMDLLSGQGGLEILRLEAAYRAAAPRRGRVLFRDANDLGRLGWREITAVGADGQAVSASNVPTSSISRRLRIYPDDLLASPLNIRTATFRFGPGQQEQAGTLEVPGSGRSLPTDAPLADLAASPRITPMLALLALLGAAGLGALHALAPGHGKTVTAAYLAGSGAGAGQAIRAALAVALMHTLSVVAVGVLVLLAEQAFPAERVYSWLGLLAGIAATSLGGWLLVSRLRSPARTAEHPHPHSQLPRPTLAALAASGGLLPSPSALIVLVASVALGRVLFGVGLIVSFSLGLAGALAGIGVLAVRAREVLLRRSWLRAAEILPVVTAAAILLAGVFLLGRNAIVL